MKKIHLLSAVLFCGFAVSLLKAEPDLDFAFSQFKGNGATPFVNALYPDPESAQKVMTRLTPALQGAGEFTGYEIVSRRFITKKVERVIIALYLEKYPVYMRIDLYDTARGRVWLPAQISKEAVDVLPLEIISTSGK